MRPPAPAMLLGGGVGECTTAIGKRVPGRFREDEVPRAVAAVAASYQCERQRNERFRDYVQRTGVELVATIARQAAGPILR